MGIVAISPDGFTLEVEPKEHSTHLEAIKEILDWKKRYKKQGYYSSNGCRIPYNEIENHCTTRKIK